MKASFRIDEAMMEKYVEKLRISNERRLSQVEPPEQASQFEYLVFSLDGQEYALELLKVRLVLALPKVTPVPFAPPYYRGVINLHGQIVSVVDLRLRLGLEAREPDLDTSVVVVDRGSYAIGLMVDSINRVLYVNDEEDVKPALALELERALGSGRL